MAELTNQVNRTLIQRVCIGIGIGLITIGFVGIVVPGFMGMHLSFAHNLIHLVSGALGLWVGYSGGPRRAYTYCVIFGTIYGLLGLAGYVIGMPGYPSVGNMEADQNLLRVIPNVLEFGNNDHAIHIFFSGVLLFTALTTTKRHSDADRSLVDVQRRKDFADINSSSHVPNAYSDLPDADLGRSDINRPADIKHREDFERRI